MENIINKFQSFTILLLFSCLFNVKADPNLFQVKWPKSGKAKVTEVSVMNGKKVEFSYDVVIKSRENNLRIVQHRDLRLLKFDDKEIPESIKKDISKKINLEAMSFTDLIIDLNGSVVDIPDFESITNVNIRNAISKKGMSEEKADRITKQYQSDKFKDMAWLLYSKRWQQWNLQIEKKNLKLNEPFSVKWNREIMGTTIEIEAMFQLNKVGNDKISITSKVKDIDTEEYLDLMLASMAGLSDDKKLEARAKFEKVELRSKAKTVISSETNFPLWIESATSLKVELKDSEYKGNSEYSQYKFEWE